MGRWGTDVMALACIAGGAVVGAGVTAGLTANTDPPAHVRCADADGGAVVVRLGSGSVYTARHSVHVGGAHDGCDASMRIQIVESAEWTAEVKERAEAARARAEEARLQADEMRLRMDELRLHLEEVRVAGEEAEAGATEVGEIATAAALEAVERQLSEAERRWAESGLDGQALTQALESLRRSLRDSGKPGGNN